jgi:L-cystine uptake protein TcyP (sodium:dicarboxylate symporter family)
MIRFKSVIAVLLFTALIGCSAQLVERPKEQEASRAKQEEERKLSMPTFTYRPGAGLMIEGR